jgi:hypothetical protein
MVDWEMYEQMQTDAMIHGGSIVSPTATRAKMRQVADTHSATALLDKQDMVDHVL